jgi:broad specificity phosphatase PhoE
MKVLISIMLFIACTSLHAKEISILLIRHGETQWNVEKRVQGQTDIPLNEKGMTQAKMTAEKLSREHPDISAIYSSDLSRACSTAEATAKKFNLPINVRHSFREMNAGSSEGMALEEKIALYKNQWEEINKKYPEKREQWTHSPVPGEETISKLNERVKNELICLSMATPNKGKVAVFSHGKVIQAFIADIEDKELNTINVPNCAVIEIFYNSENDTHPFSVAPQAVLIKQF